MRWLTSTNRRCALFGSRCVLEPECVSGPPRSDRCFVSAQGDQREIGPAEGGVEGNAELRWAIDREGVLKIYSICASLRRTRS